MTFSETWRLRWVVVVMLVTLSVLAESPPEPTPHPPKRIVSLAPSTTEILFALGLQDRLVGVTRYCDYPPAATTIAQVGGYVDPSYEAIVSLKPDLVVLLTSHRDAKSQLDQMMLRTLTVPHRTVGDIHEAIRLIGDACGESKAARAFLDELTRRREAVRSAVTGKPHPRVLLCIGRDTESEQLAGMCMAGRNGLYDEIIELAGGVNAYRDERVAYPLLSAEGVLQLNPGVIVDLVSHLTPGKKTPEQIEAQWGPLRTVTAVRNKQVHVIVGSFALRPGPRYIEFLEHMAGLLHQEAFTINKSDARRSTGH